MARYQARWIDPATGRPRVREFVGKRAAEAFRDLPRETAVSLKRVSEAIKNA